MRRALAIIAAALMIGLALLVRSRLDSNKTEAAAPSGTLVCATELQAACEQLAATNPSVTVRIEAAGVTLDKLSAGGATAAGTQIDAWLVPQPVPAMVDEARKAAALEPVLEQPSKVLARTPVVFTIWNDRDAALQSFCPQGDVTWTCIGSVAGQPWSSAGGQGTWGNIKAGLPTPDTSATGLLALAQASEQKLGRPDYASNDFDQSFQDWLTALKRSGATTSAQTPLEQMLSTGPATFAVAGSIEATAGPAVQGAARYKDKLANHYPAPVATADLVVVPVRGSEAGGRVQSLLESDEAAGVLARNGWRVPGQSSAPGVTDTALPDTNGLPRAGVMLALRDAWKEVK